MIWMTSKGSIIQTGFYTLVSPKSLIQKQQIFLKQSENYKTIQELELLDKKINSTKQERNNQIQMEKVPEKERNSNLIANSRR